MWRESTNACGKWLGKSTQMLLLFGIYGQNSGLEDYVIIMTIVEIYNVQPFTP